MPVIKNSQQCYEILKSVYDKDNIERLESCVLLLLNKANKYMGWVKISTGGMSGTVIDQRVIFQIVLRFNAHGIILSHNHPSGNTSPSEVDKTITRNLKSSSQILDIIFNDHIIYTTDGYYSFADEGMIL